MAAGGARPGAGKPTAAALAMRKAREKEKKSKATQAQELFGDMASEDLGEFYDSMKALATGLYMEEVDAKGNRIRVYRLKPDRQANAFLIEQARGRASQVAAAPPDLEITVVGWGRPERKKA